MTVALALLLWVGGWFVFLLVMRTVLRFIVIMAAAFARVPVVLAAPVDHDYARIGKR